ncbi:MAG: glycoside hydrolase family 15 protein [Actinomycetota bacterium]|nr:glycoside hydrolase family 15 protein [Actinomycetota bacterium]
MPPLEDYALIGDTHSAALVSRDGSIDWLCLPRFDSPACFAALLDEDTGGRWRIAPEEDVVEATRRYRGETMILDTTFHTASGSVTLTDCLAVEGATLTGESVAAPQDLLVRLVTGVEGRVTMKMQYAPRFYFGDIVPWLRRHGDAVEAVGGPDALDLLAPVEVELEGHQVQATFDIAAGEELGFLLAYHPSHLAPKTSDGPGDCRRLIADTESFWREWIGRGRVDERWRDEIVRSLLTLKALTYSPSGGIVAAPTASLPEAIGGVRNWDYRYCWLRDSTFTLEVLLDHGYTEEAAAWCQWLLRAVAGDPEDLQIMYGVLGERKLLEHELEWLAGYEGSRPVRVGNAAVHQFQLDVYGEVMDTFHSARRAGLEPIPELWDLQVGLVDFVCERWTEPDWGIWEVRSGPEHFVHSKVMAWVAIDRGIQAVEQFGRRGPVERWKETRATVRAEVLERGFNERVGSFVRCYGDDRLDASLLMLPLVGFIEATDPRMRATIEAIERDLSSNGFVLRYREDTPDGLPPGEGTFLLCSFWLVDCLSLLGRLDDARSLFERLLTLRNDVGLLAEQYDVGLKRQVGNFPQAFSHIALATSARSLQQTGRERPFRRGA